MTRVRLECITMHGNEYVLWEQEGKLAFPHGDLPEGKQPAEAVRALVDEWTATQQPKLELVDLHTSDEGLVLVFRALLTSEPREPARRVPRGQLAGQVDNLDGRYVEEALKTSLNYKLTRT